MLTALELHNKRMYKKSLHKDNRSCCQKTTVKPMTVTIPRDFTFRPVDKKPSMFSNIKSRITGIFKRRQTA